MLFRGFEFLPVDLYKSDAKEFKIEDGKIRLPFVAMRGVGLNSAEALQSAAAEGGYISVEELLQKKGITKGLIEQLEESGGLGSLPKTNQISLF